MTSAFMPWRMRAASASEIGTSTRRSRQSIQVKTGRAALHRRPGPHRHAPQDRAFGDRDGGGPLLLKSRAHILQILTRPLLAVLGLAELEPRAVHLDLELGAVRPVQLGSLRSLSRNRPPSDALRRTRASAREACFSARSSSRAETRKAVSSASACEDMPERRSVSLRFSIERIRARRVCMTSMRRSRPAISASRSARNRSAYCDFAPRRSSCSSRISLAVGHEVAHHGGRVGKLELGLMELGHVGAGILHAQDPAVRSDLGPDHRQGLVDDAPDRRGRHMDPGRDRGRPRTITERA
jgi:hypothetical protein